MTRLETRNILIDTIRKLDNCIEKLKKQPAAKRELVAMDKNGNEIECFDTIGEAVDLLGIRY